MNTSMLITIVLNLFIVIAAILYGGTLIRFVDLISVLFTLSLGLFSTIGAHGTLAFSALGAIFIDPDPNRAKVLSTVAETYGKQFLAFAWVGVLIGAILIITQIEDPAHLGPAVGVMLLPLFYALLARALVFHPLAARLHRIANT